jgi:DNA-binding NarL/FixJ family response regulator
MSAAPEIQVAVAHADGIVGEALSLLVAAQDDMRLAVQLNEITEICVAVKEREPDVLIVGSDEWSGELPRVLARVGEVSPATRTILIGKVNPARPLPGLAALRASAFLLNTDDWAEVVFAVRMIGANPDRHLILAPAYVTAALFGGEEIPLTAQQKKILVLAARGLGNKQIASRMHLAEGTVKRHLHSVYHKLGATSRSAAVRFALGNGWIQLHEITCD